MVCEIVRLLKQSWEPPRAKKKHKSLSIFVPSIVEKRFSCFSRLATPLEFSFSTKVHHHTLYLVDEKKRAATTLSSLSITHSHIHTHTSSRALDHPIFPCRRPMICFIRVSCERKIPFSLPCKYFSCLLSRRYKIIKKFLSYEDDPLLSLLAVIRSGYPVFCKTTAKVFYIHSAIALFPRSRKKERKYTREFSLSLTYESEKWQRNCRFKVTVRLLLRKERSGNWFFRAK